jgi:hypothetical protein
MLKFIAMLFFGLYFGLFYGLSYLAWIHGGTIFSFLGQLLTTCAMVPILLCIAFPTVGLVTIIAYWIIAATIAENS